MASLWQSVTEPPHFETLSHDLKTDVLVIGGGLAGILCTYMLKQAGVDCTLVEASRICSGITKNTTAKITIQHGLIYDSLIRRFGRETARLYLKANQEALKQYEKMCQSIDCNFARRDFYVYSLKNEEKVEEELLALDRLGVQAGYVEELPLPFSIAGAVQVKEQAQFNPLKFAYAIAKDLPIYENTMVTEIRPKMAITNHGRIKANQIIVASHFPFINRHGSYFLKLYQHRSYVLGLKNAPQLSGMYVDENEKGMSFRNDGDILLIGGDGHRSGKKGGGWRELERFTKKHYPQAKIAYQWATQDCMSLDSVAYIGQYSARTPGLYVATGFNKWGMTTSMVSAMLLRDLLLGKENPYAKVFSPSRSILRPQLAINSIESIMGLITPTVPRCPHLGCALQYNKAEHSWDCPCHGSRFTEEGKLIDNPSLKSIKGKV